MSGVTLLGQPAQGIAPTPTLPATVAANSSYSTPAMNAAGFHALGAGCTLSVAGTIAIQRYLDPAGTIAIGSAISQTLTGGTPGTVAVNDGQPAASWIVTISNTTGGVGNLTNTAFVATI